jgi:hypothetical protein
MGWNPDHHSVGCRPRRLGRQLKDIHALYAEWSAGGANSLTPPEQHQYEIRCCYIRVPAVI